MALDGFLGIEEINASSGKLSKDNFFSAAHLLNIIYRNRRGGAIGVAQQVLRSRCGAAGVAQQVWHSRCGPAGVV